MATNLGCFTHCEKIDFDLVAASDGIYTFKASFNNREFVITQEFVTGADILLDASLLNESYGYCMEVVGPPPSNESLGEFEFKIKVQI